MKCERIKQQPISLASYREMSPKPHASLASSDAYVCESDITLASLSATSKPQLTVSPLLAAPVSRTAQPKPQSRIGKEIFDISQQLEDFELTADLELPIEGINRRGPVTAFAHAALKDKGALVVLEARFKPALKSYPASPMERVPIVAPFFVIRALKVWMDPKTRKLKGRIQYLFIPVKVKLHDRILKNAKLPEDLLKGPGYDLRQGLPLYSWQVADAFFKIAEKQKAKTLVPSAEEKEPIKPDWDHAKILIEGNFSNQEFAYKGVRIDFAPLRPGKKHRVVIAGKLLHPHIQVRGIRSAEIGEDKTKVKIVNDSNQPDPIDIHLFINKDEPKYSSFEVRHFASKKIFLEAETGGADSKPFRIDLAEGIELDHLRVDLRKRGPLIRARKVVAKQIGFGGLGASLETDPGGTTTLESVRLSLEEGKPQFFARIKGRSSGQVRYTTDTGTKGEIHFAVKKEASGTIRADKDEAGRPRIEMQGDVIMELPYMYFRVQSPKLHGYVSTKIEQAKTIGMGRLIVWPTEKRARLEGIGGSKPFTIAGTSGEVIFHQNASAIEGWPELKKELGIAHKKVQTHLTIKPSKIEFAVGSMDFHLENDPDTQQTILEIDDARLGPIEIQGDVYGDVFAKALGPVPLPIHIPKSAMFKDATVRIGHIQDRTPIDGSRLVTFSDIFLKGTESRATKGDDKKDRSRKHCQMDRQSLEIGLRLFEFSPDVRTASVQGLAPGVHVHTWDPVLGGCTEITASP